MNNTSSGKIQSQGRVRKYTTQQFCKTANMTLGIRGKDYCDWINRNCFQRGPLECAKMMKNRLIYIRHLKAQDLSKDELMELAKRYAISVKRDGFPRGVYGVLADGYCNGRKSTARKFVSLLSSYSMLSIPLTNKLVFEILDPIRTGGNTLREGPVYSKTMSQLVTHFMDTSVGRTCHATLHYVEDNYWQLLDFGRIKVGKSRHNRFGEYIATSIRNNISPIALSAMTTLPSSRKLGNELLAHEYSYSESIRNNRPLPKKFMSVDRYSFPWLSIYDWCHSLPYIIYSKEVGGDPHEAIRIREEMRTHNAALSIVPKTGAAGRVVAKLSCWDQFFMIPVHDAFNAVTKNDTHFYHMNQLAGAKLVASWFDRGFTPVSSDLSNATDTIPRDLILMWLNKTNHREIHELIACISAQPFEVNVNKENAHLHTEVTYLVGQPMGMYGSFPILQLSNFMVASYASYLVGVEDNRENPAFAIVGDDIVFRDSIVANKYMQLMENIGVPINKTKCFANNMVQFVGFDIFKGKGEEGATYARAFKFKEHRGRWDSQGCLNDKNTKLGLQIVFPEVLYLRDFRPLKGADGHILRPWDYMADLTPNDNSAMPVEEESATRSYTRYMEHLWQQCQMVTYAIEDTFGCRRSFKRELITVPREAVSTGLSASGEHLSGEPMIRSLKGRHDDPINIEYIGDSNLGERDDSRAWTPTYVRSKLGPKGSSSKEHMHKQHVSKQDSRFDR